VLKLSEMPNNICEAINAIEKPGERILIRFLDYR